MKNLDEKHFLRQMNDAKDSSGKKLFTMKEITGMCKLLLFAGQETTSSLLNYLVYILGRETEWQEKLRQDLKKYGNDLIKFAQNSKLVGDIIREALRLHPPVYMIPRKAARDIVVEDRLYIPKDWGIGIYNLYMSRDKERWGEDALEFKPDRDQKGYSDGRFVFGGGPHHCIGRHFAMMTARVFVAAMISRYRWETKNGEVDQTGALTLSLMEDIRIELKPLN